MEAKEAVRTAKEYIGDSFSEEGLFNLGLEEVAFDGVTWKITVGFSGSWDLRNPLNTALDESFPERSHKIFRIIDKTGTVESIKDRIPRISLIGR